MRAIVETIFRAAPQLSRYTIVSALALALDLVCYLMLIEAGLRASAAAVVGYAAGLLLHYALTTRFVFDAARTAKSDARLFVEFAVSGGFGVAITYAIIATSTDVFAVHPLLAKAVAVAASFIAVYALRKTIVFADASPALETGRRSG